MFYGAQYVLFWTRKSKTQNGHEGAGKMVNKCLKERKKNIYLGHIEEFVYY